ERPPCGRSQDEIDERDQSSRWTSTARSSRARSSRRRGDRPPRMSRSTGARAARWRARHRAEIAGGGSARLSGVVDSPLLRLEGVTKRYPGVTALDDLTVEVPRGRVGLVGANGAGKTTTFRLLLGLAHPTEGRI